MNAPIASAASRPLFPATTQPNMASAIAGLTQVNEVQILRTVLVAGETHRQIRKTTAATCIQPLSAQRIAMKPEGERAWKWWMIHATNDLMTKVGDILEITGVGYRLMACTDYSAAGYSMFEAVEDYRHA
jgi:isopentenyl diphosphate isomerase/L-lactate dehydrogenase-like FMN-dependent dehydrogenase